MIHYNNLHNAQASGQSSRSLPAGGYIAQIQSVRETVTKTGAPMLVINIDIADGEYKGIMRSKVNGDKWPNVGIFRMMLPPDQNAPADDWRLSRLKGFINAVAESNPSFTWRDDERAFRGQYVGVLYQDEEYIGTDGNKHVSAKPAFWCSTERIRSGDYTTPRPKILAETAVSTPQTYTSIPQDDFMPVESAIGGDTDLPF